jgi:hypothetical protein
MTSLPALRSATHVVFDSITMERLLQLGATNVVRASDCLIIGPSRQDPLEHARLRQAWWNSSEQWDRLYLPEVHWKPPVAVWVSASIVERVNLWRTCSWLRHLGVATRDVLVLELDAVPPGGIPEEPLPSFDGTSSVADHPDTVLLDHFAHARPFSPERYGQAVSLWEKYIDENPLPFVRCCLRGVKGFPELAPLWAFLSYLFPRKTMEGVLRLSRLDELLLSILSGEWQTAVQVFVHKSDPGVELRQLLSCTGDLFLPDRLDQWSTHGSSPAVERAPGPKPPGDSPMLSSVYRLTESGLRIREEGLKQLSDAPSLPFAGIEAYTLRTPWVLLEDGRLARL